MKNNHSDSHWEKHGFQVRNVCDLVDKQDGKQDLYKRRAKLELRIEKYKRLIKKWEQECLTLTNYMGGE